MKRLFFLTLIVATVISMHPLLVSAGEWLWMDPALLAVKVGTIGANPVTGDVYGIDEAGNIVILDLSDTVTGAEASAGSMTPVKDLAVGPLGAVYAMGDFGIGKWDPTTYVYTPITQQPKVPEGAAGTYKGITMGRFAKMYVLFETTGGSQYILRGFPPAITDGVVIKISPGTINLAAKGNWLTCTITLPQGYSPKDIDPESIRITKIELNLPGMDPIVLDVDIPVASGTSPVLSGTKAIVKFPRFDMSLLENIGLASAASGLSRSASSKLTIGATVTVEASLKTTGEGFSGTVEIKLQVPAIKF